MNSYVFAGEMKGSYNDVRRALRNARAMFNMVEELNEANRRRPGSFDVESVLSYFRIGLDYLAAAESSRKRAREWRGHMNDARRWEASLLRDAEIRRENEEHARRNQARIDAAIAAARGAA